MMGYNLLIHRLPPAQRKIAFQISYYPNSIGQRHTTATQIVTNLMKMCRPKIIFYMQYTQNYT